MGCFLRGDNQMSLSEKDFEYLKEHIRQVPDFPKPGILFLDITTSVKDAKSLKLTLDYLQEAVQDGWSLR